eukprot:CAMPEP_0174761182 /NCGR_PEP_ID=MMETSP1094-20130205/109147_1 /TAXON_ID=156173 /ORGANISM="Chrysochromulina brevifilum, Strain UTEX LB 985" /LENGTH=33 /DNA_ID= /DNA_START= /DNA_END= /DNA_ORIENTATION=
MRKAHQAKHASSLRTMRHTQAPAAASSHRGFAF